MLIRPATVDDAHDLAVVHVRSWQQAYRGLMPQAVLDRLSIAEREAGWARLLASDGARKVDTRPGLVLHERRHVKRLD